MFVKQIIATAAAVLVLGCGKADAPSKDSWVIVAFVHGVLHVPGQADRTEDHMYVASDGVETPEECLQMRNLMRDHFEQSAAQLDAQAKQDLLSKGLNDATHVTTLETGCATYGQALGWGVPPVE